MKAPASICTTNSSGTLATERLALALKALGHPVRLAMVRQLAERNRCCCADFCACLPLAQSTVSQHLDLLRQAGIVDYSPDGNKSRYSLNAAALASLGSELRNLAAIKPKDSEVEENQG